MSKYTEERTPKRSSGVYVNRLPWSADNESPPGEKAWDIAKQPATRDAMLHPETPVLRKLIGSPKVCRRIRPFLRIWKRGNTKNHGLLRAISF